MVGAVGADGEDVADDAKGAEEERQRRGCRSRVFDLRKRKARGGYFVTHARQFSSVS
ncbi:MAG: hypothetical protein IKD47_00280 [Clostridia bacterium]|nr:hypothetical protein [Clostridia bacterium]